MITTRLKIKIRADINDDWSFDDIVQELGKGLPPEAKLGIRQFNCMDDETNHDRIDVEGIKWCASALTDDDYIELGRNVGDLKGITFSEMCAVGKPLPRGGGGGIFQKVVEFIIVVSQTNAPVILKSLPYLAEILKLTIHKQLSRDDKRSLSIKLGENEITVTGYSKEDTDKMIDEFFARVIRNQLTK